MFCFFCLVETYNDQNINDIDSLSSKFNNSTELFFLYNISRGGLSLSQNTLL